MMDTSRLAQLLVDTQAWLAEHIFTMEALYQLGGALVAGLAALGLGTLLRRGYEARFQRAVNASDIAGRLARAVGRVLWLALFAALVSAARIAVVESGHDGRILDMVASLALVWIAIRLASAVMRAGPLRTVVSWTAWIVAALHILGLLGPTAELLDGLAVTLGDVRLSVLMVLKGAALLLVLLKAVSIVNVVATSRYRAADLSPSLQALFIKLTRLGLYTGAFLMVVSAMGVDLTSLAVLSGALGVGIGFGLREIFANLVSGVILLMERSVKPGDVIEVEGVYGEVTELNIRYCVVRTRDGKEFLMPNESFITNPVVVWTHRDPVVRIKVPIGIHYEADPRLAMELILQAARDTGRILDDPAPMVQLIEFGDNSVNLEARIWINDAQHGVANVRSALLLKVWDAFQEHGIGIPYPQRDLYLKEVPRELLAHGREEE